MADSVHARGLQAEVIVRCMALIVRLLRGPASKADLLEIIRFDTEALTDKALERRLEEDRNKRLKGWFGCNLTYDFGERLYKLEGFEQPWLDLPPEAARGIAFLQQTFSDPKVPMSEEVLALINSLLLLFPIERKKQIARERGLLEIDLRQRDQGITPAVWEKVEQALAEQRLIEFEYGSPQQADGQLRRHRGEPVHYYFNSDRQHYYLDVWVTESHGPKGNFPPNALWPLRLDRMQNLHVLPTKFVPGPRMNPPKELTYWLAPQIARRGVTERFHHCVVERQPDGSAIVQALSTNLFMDLRSLLYYGPGCRVLGDEDALKEMRKLVADMAAHYVGHDS